MYKNLIRCLFFTLLLSGYVSQAQTGAISGIIKDAENKEELIGVTVLLQGPNKGAATDVEGKFVFNTIPVGVYSLKITYVGYNPLTIQDVRVEEGKMVTFDLEMTPSSGQNLAEVVITSKRVKNTTQAILSEIKAVKQVVSGISQEQIKMSQDRDAAQVMSRIPGLTIVDNRFVMVRGIPERYNQVMLNVALAPSTEIDKRTFSFDLIPSGVLERMMIFKSGSPDNPGDFAGGLVKVYTSSAADENHTKFSIGTNFRANTTFQPFVSNRSSSTDFLGFDGGERKLPKGFPTENLRSFPNSSPVLTEAPKLLNNDLSYKTANATPDMNFGADIARSWFLGNKKLSMISTINYSQSQQYYQRNFNRYEIQNPANYGTPAPYRLQFLDDRYEKENRIGVLTNWALRLNSSNKLEFKNLFNQIGENITVLRNGRDFVQQSDRNRQNYMYGYRQRTIYSGQLEGTHDFDEKNTKVTWVLGSNFLSENQPDLRRFRTIQTSSDSEEYEIIPAPSSNLFDTGRYFGKLREISVNNNVAVERNIGGSVENPITLRAGYLVDFRSRQFDSRYFSYTLGSNITPAEQNRLLRLPLDQVFANENFRQDGFIAAEGTNLLDSYEGTNFLSAAYVGATIPVNDFTFVGGIRGEYNILKMNTYDAGNNPINVNNKLFSPLGFLNVDYSISESQKLRFGYGRTVNRPEFREVAPFLFYDYEMDANRNGNPNLKTATINNLDLRYELYPRSGETISLGVFYKNFKNPIETVVILQSESQAFSLTNAASAYNYGVEIEVRKSFKGLTSSRFVDNMSINLNGSLITSQVDYGSSVNASVQDTKRPLQGQSPYIANAVLNYHDEKSGWNIGAGYNIIGTRIFAIGNVDFPTIYELPRNALDLTVSKTLSKSFAVKVGIQDLLNAPYRFFQDTNRDRKIDSVNDDLIIRYQRGTLFTTVLTYTIK
jgi:hypothetical protein